MKKSFIIILAVLTSLVANAQLYTNNAAVLRVDSICLKGNMMDMLVQHV